MPTPPIDPEAYRRRQRRRALIGWIGGFFVLVAFVVLIAVGGGGEHHRRLIKVPYGDVMTSHDFEEVHLGEEDVVVLERLAGTGRPEELTKEYVLVLFPPVPEDAYCVYWEFSDEQQIFARLCFDKGDGEMIEKRKRNVLHPPVGGQSTVV
jgi:hypothetical protein